jgi:hypothetical protein
MEGAGGAEMGRAGRDHDRDEVMLTNGHQSGNFFSELKRRYVY